MPDMTPNLSLDEAIDRYRATDGRTLRAMSEESTVMLVFLRHSGCPFCREAAADLAAVRARLKQQGIQPVVVLQGDEADARRLLDGAGLSDTPRVLDPDRALYRAFGLKRGSIWQLAGPFVWWRTAQALLAGHRIGRAVGDAFQMPGVFVLRRGKLVSAFRHRSQADRPDYCALAPAAAPPGA